MNQKNNAYNTALKCICHPISIFSIIILIINDHFLKALYPSFLTGKISDFAGLIFFPFLIAFFLSFFQTVNKKIKTDFIFLSAFILTGLFFTLIKTVNSINISVINIISKILPYDFTISKDQLDLIALLSLIPGLFIFLNQRRPKNKSINKKASLIIILLASFSCIATSYSVDLAYKIYTSENTMVITVNYFRNGSIRLYLPEECYENKNINEKWELKKLNEIDEKLQISISDDYKDMETKTLVKSKTIIHPNNDNILYKIIVEEKIEVSYDKGITWKTAWQYPENRNIIYKRQHWSNFRGQKKGPYDIAFTPDNSGRLIVTLGEEGIVIKDENDIWHQQSLGNITATPYTIIDPLIFLNIIPMELNFFLSFLILIISSTCFIFQIININRMKNQNKQIIKKINRVFLISTILFITAFVLFIYTLCYFILHEYPDMFKNLLLDEGIFTLLLIYYAPAFFHLEILISLILIFILISYIIIIRMIINNIIKLMKYKINKIPILISFYSLIILIFPVTVLYIWSAGLITGYNVSLIISIIIYLFTLSITSVISVLQIKKIINN